MQPCLLLEAAEVRHCQGVVHFAKSCPPKFVKVFSNLDDLRIIAVEYAAILRNARKVGKKVNPSGVAPGLQLSLHRSKIHGMSH